MRLGRSTAAFFIPMAIQHPDELVARIKAGAQFMSLKIVARCVNVPLPTVKAYVIGKMRADIQPDQEVVRELTRILRDGAVV